MKIIVISGDIGWEVRANDIRAALKSANGEDVRFDINSPGGFVFEGFEIFNIIRGYEGNTESRIIGLAASMASYIALAADKVTAFDNAGFFIHNAWNIAIGDHNDLRKTANTLESLSKIIARVYVGKTGKAIEDIAAFMDDETFFFGDDIKIAGFVDEIIEAPENSNNDTDKDSALITARATVEVCKNKLRESEAANTDFQKAVAHVNSTLLLNTPAVPKGSDEDIPKKPAPAGNNIQEEEHMTFKEYFAANPTAQLEYDKAIADARNEGEVSATAKIKVIVDKVSPILSSASYSAAIKECGIKAITGEGSIDTFNAVVVIEDQKIEEDKAAAAAAESTTGGETAPVTPEKTEEAEAKFQAKSDRIPAGG